MVNSSSTIFWYNCKIEVNILHIILNISLSHINLFLWELNSIIDYIIWVVLSALSYKYIDMNLLIAQLEYLLLVVNLSMQSFYFLGKQVEFVSWGKLVVLLLWFLLGKKGSNLLIRSMRENWWYYYEPFFGLIDTGGSLLV